MTPRHLDKSRRREIIHHTSVNDIMIVGKVKRQQQLDSEAPHHLIRDRAIWEPGAKASEGLADKFEHEAQVRPIRALMLKVVNKMTDLRVP